MDARELLEDVKRSVWAVRNIQKTIDDLDALIGASGISYDRDKISSSPRKDGLEIAAIHHLEEVEKAKKDLIRATAEMASLKKTALLYIAQLDSEEQREILRMRYLDGMKWWQILEAKNADSLSGQTRLRDRAVEELQRIIDNAGE